VAPSLEGVEADYSTPHLKRNHVADAGDRDGARDVEMGAQKSSGIDVTNENWFTTDGLVADEFIVNERGRIDFGRVEHHGGKGGDTDTRGGKGMVEGGRKAGLRWKACSGGGDERCTMVADDNANGGSSGNRFGVVDGAHDGDSERPGDNGAGSTTGPFLKAWDLFDGDGKAGFGHGDTEGPVDAGAREVFVGTCNLMDDIRGGTTS